MAYTKTEWVNDSKPAISAENLNKIEQGIADAHAIVATPGKSAYDIAVDNGFEGSEVEWLASLKGEPGKDAPDQTAAIEALEARVAALETPEG
ncbi:hypothetical protein [Corynebacterium stationis]|uniref:hypothetical protein n=1 Tax=Corynebacterium stationis TaxID=1705 RepID=UPI0028AE7F86|nr:hypothetical protein [Corynebacterium stationis]